MTKIKENRHILIHSVPPEGPTVADTPSEVSLWALIAWQLGILCAHYLYYQGK